MKVSYNTTLGEMHDACPFVDNPGIDCEAGEALCAKCDFNSICAVFPDEWDIDMASPAKKHSDKVVINIYGNVNISHESEVKENECIE